MQNYTGSIVAIEPSTGEILCLVTSPSYNPSDFIGKKRNEIYPELISDPLKPLFDRTILSTYAPGSTIKMLTALIGLVGFLMSSPIVALVFLSILGLGMYMPMGVSMAYAQEFLPEHRGFASSLTLGVSWGFASFSVIPITNIAESIGLMNAFWFLPLALVLALFLAFCLPKESIN